MEREVPEVNYDLAKQAADFFIANLEERGIGVYRWEASAEFDPDDGDWYFVVDIYTDIKDDVELMGRTNWEIVDKLAEQWDETQCWAVDYTVILKFDQGASDA